jgi:hypothetical protein
MSEEEQVSLASLRGGAAVEMFDGELQRILDNISDPNTTLATREVTLKVKIKPSSSRTMGQVDITCSAKTAPNSPVSSSFYLGRDRNRTVAFEYNPEQLRLKLEQEQIKGPTLVDGKAVNHA